MANVRCSWSSDVGNPNPVNAESYNATTIEIDFGAVPIWSKSFIITDANVTANSVVIASQSFLAATGRQQDENEMDSLQCRCKGGAGSFTLFVDSQTGPLTGKWKITYSRH